MTHLKSEILGDSCEQLLEVGEKEFLGGTTMRRTGTIGDNRESWKTSILRQLSLMVSFSLWIRYILRFLRWNMNRANIYEFKRQHLLKSLLIEQDRANCTYWYTFSYILACVPTVCLHIAHWITNIQCMYDVFLCSVCVMWEKRQEEDGGVRTGTIQDKLQTRRHLAV